MDSMLLVGEGRHMGILPRVLCLVVLLVCWLVKATFCNKPSRQWSALQLSHLGLIEPYTVPQQPARQTKNPYTIGSMYS